MLNENIGQLTESDVVCTSFPNSGSSLLGNMLLELGINYVEGYQERLCAGSRTEIVDPYWRERWQTLSQKEALLDRSVNMRVVKTHFLREPLSHSRCRKAILLVRDPRDAVLSYYHWLMGFSEAPQSFSQFLANDVSFASETPLRGWLRHYRSWVGVDNCWDMLVVTYENLKFYPRHELERVLNFLGIPRSSKEIVHAVDASSFARARAREDSEIKKQSTIERRSLETLTTFEPAPPSAHLGDVSASSFIFRKGLVGEWRSAFKAWQLNELHHEAANELYETGYRFLRKTRKSYDVLVFCDNALSLNSIRSHLERARTRYVIAKGGGANRRRFPSFPPRNKAPRLINSSAPRAGSASPDSDRILPAHFDLRARLVIDATKNTEISRAIAFRYGGVASTRILRLT